MTDYDKLKLGLESLIDKFTLHVVLAGLGDVCMEKAEHIGSNWQDDKLAERWARKGMDCTKLALKVAGGPT